MSQAGQKVTTEVLQPSGNQRRTEPLFKGADPITQYEEQVSKGGASAGSESAPPTWEQRETRMEVWSGPVRSGPVTCCIEKSIVMLYLYL